MTDDEKGTQEPRIYLRGVSLPLSLAEQLIVDARLHDDGMAEALERALALRDRRNPSSALAAVRAP